MICPACGAREVPSDTPRTTYACGSSDYDQRPGTFTAVCANKQPWKCPCGHELTDDPSVPPYDCTTPGCECGQCRRSESWPVERDELERRFQAAIRERGVIGARRGLSEPSGTGPADERVIFEGLTPENAELTLGLLGEVGGVLSVTLIAEKVAGWSREVQRAALHALGTLGGLESGIALALVATDPHFGDEERRRAFHGLEEIASFGSSEVAEGGLVSIDPAKVGNWLERRESLDAWGPTKVWEVLSRATGTEWELRAKAVWGVVATMNLPE